MSEIYALSDDVFTPNKTIFSQVNEILKCGVKILQYRSKTDYQDEKLISSLISLCEDYGAKLIINDNVSMAKRLNAHGVHIGRNDTNLCESRKILGKDKIIGVSCYNDIKLAKYSQLNGANYIAFGAMYQSCTKPNAPTCPYEVIVSAKKEIEIPICLIGGINLTNLDEILNLNPEFIAFVSAIYEPNSITDNIKKIQEKINEYNRRNNLRHS